MKNMMKSLNLAVVMFLSAAMMACGGKIEQGNGNLGFLLGLMNTDESSVALDKSSLSIEFAPGDSSSSVTQNIILPLAGSHGSTITWDSSDAAIDTDGTVTRPLPGDGNATVTLTATLTKGDVIQTKVFIITVIETPISDIDAVAQAKAALAIGYQSADSASSVTLDVTLTTSGANGTSISWDSDNGAIDTAGNVTRPSFTAGDATVTLTATISKGLAIDTKVFVVTVIKQPITDAESVAQARAALAIGYQGTDSASSVTLDVTLDTTGSNGTTISWGTTNGAVIDTLGNVTRPAFLSGDASVTLTATITKNLTSDTKQFVLTVIKLPITDAECVSQDKSSLAIGYSGTDSASSVTLNVTLPTSGSNGTTIGWASTNGTVIDTMGNVTRPSFPTGNVVVTLTATITKNTDSDTRQFVLTVTKLPPNDDEAVAQDKSSLAIGYQGSDNANSVTLDVTLPTSGSNGTSISWATDDATAITTLGAVTRPGYFDGNPVVTLTATITKNLATDTRTFTLKVIRLSIAPGDFEGRWEWADGGATTGLNKDTVRHAINPNMTVFSNELYVAWSEFNSSTSQIRVRKYDGSTWSWVDGGGSTGINYDTGQNAIHPYLIVFSGNLYAIWSETYSGVYVTRVKRYDGGSTWTAIDGSVTNGLNMDAVTCGSTSGPTMGICNGYLYATWVETYSGASGAYQLHVKRYDSGTSWTFVDGGGFTGLNYDTSKTANKPKLLALGNTLYLIWTEINPSNKYIVRVKRYDGGSTWTTVDGGSGLNYNTGNTVDEARLVIYNSGSGDALYAYWLENYYVRMKSYDGSTWSSADNNAGFKQNTLNYAYAESPPAALTNNNNRTFWFTWGEDISYTPWSIQTRAAEYIPSSMSFVDGNDWTKGLNYNVNQYAYKQAIAFYNHYIYVAWYESNGSANQLRVKKIH